MTTKIDLKRELGDLYRARAAPALVEVPELSFLMVDGQGDPNGSSFREAVEALYSVSYTLKFTLRSAPERLDYQVMPLEALWWSEDMSSLLTRETSHWNWTAMIDQPELMSGELVADAVETAAHKRPLPAAAKLRLERFHEGEAAQVMHVGPYAAERPTIARLHKFIAAQGLTPARKHHEIYLGDPGRAAPERLRTIIRRPVDH